MKPCGRVPGRSAVAFALLLAVLIGVTPTSLAAQSADEPPLCQDCHPDEYEMWQDSTHAIAESDARFQAALQDAENDEACLRCHSTGTDTATGAGISCEACHGDYVEGHPGDATMVLPMASQTCQNCHRAAFTEWENSTHGSSNIECFDCHLAHSQGLRTGGEATLCSACHETRAMEATHVTHDIDGLECSGCHMRQQTTGAHEGMMLPVASSVHDFGFDSQACVDCHTEAVSKAVAATTTGDEETAAPTEKPSLVDEATAMREVEALQRRLASLRSVAVAGMGLAFGVGGFLGLVAGLAVMAIVRRPHDDHDKRSAA